MKDVDMLLAVLASSQRRIAYELNSMLYPVDITSDHLYASATTNLTLGNAYTGITGDDVIVGIGAFVDLRELVVRAYTGDELNATIGVFIDFKETVVRLYTEDAFNITVTANFKLGQVIRGSVKDELITTVGLYIVRTAI